MANRSVGSMEIYLPEKRAWGDEEVALMESLAAQMELFFEFWPYMNMVASRLGQKPIQPLEVMECRDGYIFVCCAVSEDRT